MAFLYEIYGTLAERRYQGQKYWIDYSSNLKMNWAQDSDYIIEIKSDGSYEYRKNRLDGSKEVLPRDGSYDWITLQILSSMPVPKSAVGLQDAVLYYAPYVPVIHANAASVINEIVYRTRYDTSD